MSTARLDLAKALCRFAHEGQTDKAGAPYYLHPFIVADKVETEDEKIVSKEFYQRNADSFLLISSDSDFWALINDLKEARFFILAEKMKCSIKFLDTLCRAGTPYGFIDHFCTGNCDHLKQKTLVAQLQKKLDSIFQVNISALLSDVIYENRAQMTPTEREQFFRRYIKPVRASITEDGELHLLLSV